MVLLYNNVGDVGRPLVGLQGRITENVGRPLVGLQGNITKNLHFRIGEPLGPPYIFLQQNLNN
jgi:hypothetical protein